MIPTVQELKRGWNSVAKLYSRMIEKPNLQLGISLSRMLNLQTANNIVEVGCGSGLLSLYLLQNLPPGRKITSIDLSNEMISIAQQTKASLASKINNIDQEFIEGNAEDLSFIPNESVDAYLSSLCLHLVSDPNKALQESMRILKKGGRIGFSVLGSEENCSFFQVFNERLKEFNIHVPEKRSVFYLGDREKLIKFASDNGIKVDFCWKENVAMGLIEEDDVEVVAGLPSHRKIIKELDEEKRGMFLKAMKEDFLRRKKEFMPLVTENTLLIGRKE